MEWSLFNKGVFLVNLLGIIYDPDTKRILIGRRVNDPNLKNLTWVFPGGRPDYKNEMDDNLKFEVKENTGLDVNVKDVVFAKTYPERREFLSIYYLCECVKCDGNEKPSGNLTELKWVKPTEVAEYFTTSLHPTVLEYLRTLE